MRIVTAPEQEEWRQRGTTLEKDGRGPKVIQLPDGRILKIFHSRRHPVLNWLQPPARRFADNRELLARAGIAVPTLTEICWLDKPKGLTACLYQPLPGDSLESIFKRDPDQLAALLPQLGAFIAELHAKGIYFRSLHLGNIIRQPDGQFGLIDFLDLKGRRRPLSQSERQRNFRHFANYLERSRLEHFPLQQLETAYRQAVEAAAQPRNCA